MLFLPVIQWKLKLLEEKPLDGAITKMESVSFLPSKWFNASFQEEYEKWFNQEFGFRNFLVRFNNQISFSFFKKAKARDVVVGKKNYLFERKYIQAATKSDFMGIETVQNKFQLIGELQDTLSAYGVDLILVFAPGKASFFKEYIPDRFKQKDNQGNLDLFIKTARGNQISYLDLNSWFIHAKDSTRYPLYPQYGIHWSDYGSLLAADTLFRFIEEKRRVKLSRIEIESVRISDELSETDYDIARGMNLLCRLKSFDMAYPKYRIVSDQNKDRLNVITVADSYYWQIFGNELADHVLGNNQFWYYNQERHSYKEGKIVPVESLNILDEMKKQDVIIIMATDANLPDIGWGFIEKSHAAFFNVQESRNMELVQNFKKPIDLQKDKLADIVMRKMDKIYSKAILLLLGIFYSCTSSNLNVESNTYHQDFDNLQMWTRDAAVTDEQAHSGRYSAYTDENREFSQTFEMSFDYAKSQGFKYVVVTAWCMMADYDSEAAFVTSVESPDQNPIYQSPRLTEFLKKPMAWGKYSTSIKLPEIAPEKTNIKVYLWSSKRQKAWMDDVTIEFDK